MKNESVKIYNRFLRPSAVGVDFGNGKRTVFVEEVQPKGNKKLVSSGTENFKEFIQMSKEECLIDNIIKKYERGDLGVLNVRPGFYADISNMPTNMQDAQNFIIKLHTDFDKLPLEIRKEYNFSFDTFLSEVVNYDTEMLASKFGNISPGSDNSSSAAGVSESVVNNDKESD